MRRLGMLVAALATFVAFQASAADQSLSAAANAAFLADNAHKSGVYIRPSGLQYRIIQNGNGKRPGARDTVTVYYKGSLINGKVFDSTEPGLPANFKVNQLIAGWTEALQLMREGDHWELVIPPSIAYGSRGAGDAIPPDQVLVFDLELVSVTPASPAQPDQDQDQDNSSGY